MLEERISRNLTHNAMVEEPINVIVLIPPGRMLIERFCSTLLEVPLPVSWDAIIEFHQQCQVFIDNDPCVQTDVVENREDAM